MNAETYYTDPRLSATEIKAFALGGEIGYLHARDEKDTPAMKLGRALHCAVLQPENFFKLYAEQKFDGRTKEGKAEKANAEEQGITLISSDDWKSCETAMKLHPHLQLFDTEHEYYTDTLKCKIDAYDPSSRRLVEFKSINEIFNAEKDFWARAYDLQLGHYNRVMEENGIEVNEAIVYFFSPSQGLATTLEIPGDKLAEFKSRAAMFADAILARPNLRDRTENAEKAIIPAAVVGDRPVWVADREDIFLL